MTQNVILRLYFENVFVFYDCTEFSVSVIKFWPSLSFYIKFIIKHKFSNRPQNWNSEDCLNQEMTGENGLEVIGAGFSKTGTKTMHHVYKILGYGVNDSHENVFL